MQIYLQKGRERSVLHRHPWIFSGAIAKVEGDATAGATTEILSSKGERLGWGSYSPNSQIRVRMLVFGNLPVPDAAYIKGLVRASIGRRSDNFAQNNAGIRLIHGESDGLPGVVADWYAGWVSVQLSTAGAEFWRAVIIDALSEIPALKGIYERSDVDSREREGLPMVKQPLMGGEPPLIEISEGNIRYFVDIVNGHKTGFYLDQREARAAVGALAVGREVLNCFSYTGGFGLAALAGGAKFVTNLDISKNALELAQKNVILNDAEWANRCEMVACDVFKQLRLYRDQARKFDLIVLDPPKFADTKAQVMRAARGYKDINLLALKLLRPGGVLATFSCSGGMTDELFDKIIAEAALDANRPCQIIGRTRQAADHPVLTSFPEGHYLKGLILRIFS